MAESVDATNAPRDLLDRAGLWEGQDKKVMRLFSLAFHHFDDELAGNILKNTVETADGFALVSLGTLSLPTRSIQSIDLKLTSKSTQHLRTPTT